MNSVGFSWRRKKRQPSWWVMVSLLCLAIGSSVAVVVAFNEVVLKPLPGPQPERVLSMGGLAYGDGLGDPIAWWHVEGLDDLARYSAGDAKCESASMGERWVRVTVVSGALFEVFGQPPLVGRTLQRSDEFENRRVTVIRADLWELVRGRAATVDGVSIRLNGSEYSVIGVVPQAFAFPSESQVWVSETRADELRLNLVQGIGELPPIRSETGWVGRLKPTATLVQVREQLKARLDAANATRSPTSGINYGGIIGASVLQDRLAATVRPHLTVLLISVAIMLLLAIANCSLYSVTMAIDRRPETALKVSLGASRSVMYKELVSEIVLMTGICLVGTLLFAWVMLDLSRSLLFAFRVYLPPFAVVLPAVLGLSVLTTVVVSAIATIPAISMMRSLALASIANTLAGSGRGPRRLWIRRVIAAGAAAMSTLLIAGALVADYTFAEAMRTPLGHDSRGVMATRKLLPPREVKGDAFTLKRRELMLAVNTVGANSAVASVIPVTEAARMYQVVKADGPGVMASVSNIDGPFFQVMGIPVVAGRAIDSVSDKFVVVNRTLAEELWGDVGKAIGQSVAIAGPAPDWEVVAVVEDSRTVDQRNQKVGQIYIPFGAARESGGMVSVEVLAACPTTCSQQFTSIVDAIRQVPGGFVGRSDTIANLEWKARAKSVVAATVWSIFAIVAGLLSIVASATLAAQSVAQRRIEIGVRGALGATPGRLTRMLTLGTLVSLATGAAIGIFAAQPIVRVIENAAEGVQPPRLLAVVMAGLVVTGAGTLVAFLIARKASRTSVASLLRVT